LFPEHGGEQVAWTADVVSLLDQIERTRGAGRRVAVLVSGDPGLCSLARRVIERFGRHAVEVIPGISSVQVAFARLGLDWTHARIVSAHGRTPEIAPDELPRGGEIAVLAGSREALQWSAAAARSLESSHAAILCENLTLPDECVRPMTPDQLDAATVSPLSLVLLIRRNLIG
jgi:precorrin-6y C5,15-methyltransferase (decarboxylating) CbiE subunit